MIWIVRFFCFLCARADGGSGLGWNPETCLPLVHLTSLYSFLSLSKVAQERRCREMLSSEGDTAIALVSSPQLWVW